MKTIPFDYSKYKNEGYEVVCRDGRKVEQLHQLFIPNGLRLCGVVNGEIIIWIGDGSFNGINEGSLDLFLVAKPVERFQGVFTYGTSAWYTSIELAVHFSLNAVAYIRATFSDDSLTELLTVQPITP